LTEKFVKAKDATTDLFGQTMHYGYGAFEGIRAYQNCEWCKKFSKLTKHFERLKRSCELIGIPFSLRYRRANSNFLIRFLKEII
jgi:branched-chain amino acid aminotransferase